MDRAWLVTRFADIEFDVRVAIGEQNDCYVDVEAYRTHAWGDGREYQRADSDTSPDCTPDLARARRYLHGSVKWDGCSNLHLDEQDEAMLHFCGRKEARNIGELLARIYDLAHDVLPRPDW